MMNDPENDWDWDAIRKRKEELMLEAKGCARAQGSEIAKCWCCTAPGTYQPCPPGWQEKYNSDNSKPRPVEPEPFHLPGLTAKPWFAR